MDVLSLFDGISCGMVAAERAGLKLITITHTKLTRMQLRLAKRTIRTLLIVEM